MNKLNEQIYNEKPNILFRKYKLHPLQMELSCKRCSCMIIVTCEKTKMFDLWSCLLWLMLVLIVNIMQDVLQLKEQKSLDVYQMEAIWYLWHN